jgi:putative ABC transport system permease protein
MRNDLTQALRALRAAPGFSLAAIVTLALGIGANTALFSVADAVLLRPLPYPQPERIVSLDHPPFQFTRSGMRVTPQVEQSPTFDGVGIYAPGALNIGGEPRPERVIAAAVSAGFFSVLRAQPVAGRTFTQDEETTASRVAVISQALWTRRGQAIDVGTDLLVNGRLFTVIGIMPPRVEFPGRTDVWIPVGADTQITGRAFAPNAIARLAPGVTPSQATAEINRIKGVGSRAGAEQNPTRVTPLTEALTGHVRPLFLALASAVALVLLVACINTASLFLARVSARERDISVRQALGASRIRLVRQLFSETLLLAVCAGLLALFVATWTLSALSGLLPPTLPGAQQVAIEGHAIVVTALLALATTAVFGVAPAWSLRRRREVGILRGTPVSTAEPFWRRFRSGLVVAELAIALVLVAGAATIVRTVNSLMRTDIGARGDRVLAMETTLPIAKYDSLAAVTEFHKQLEARVLAIPGVERVGSTNLMPGSSEAGIGLPFLIERQEAPVRGSYLSATPGYFQAIGIDRLAGRFFAESDDERSTPVVIVSDSFARRAGLTPAEAVGRRVRAGVNSRWASMVGVVRDVRLKGPESGTTAQLYVPAAQGFSGGTTFVVTKTVGDPRPFASALRSAVAAVDADLPVYNIKTFDEVRAGFVADRRFAMVVMTAFAALAALLAGIGLYGVLTYLVQLRTREIGIRVALGASPGKVRRQVVRSGLLHASAGVMTGAAVATAALRVMTARVPGLQPADALLLVTVGAAMIVVAVAVTWLPARRATAIDPVEALRSGG